MTDLILVAHASTSYSLEGGATGTFNVSIPTIDGYTPFLYTVRGTGNAKVVANSGGSYITNQNATISIALNNLANSTIAKDLSVCIMYARNGVASYYQV